MVEAASQYPLMDAFWTMILFFAWIMWLWFLFMVFGDLFSRRDIGGWAKAGWTVFVLVAPFVGTLVYLIAEGRSMGERRLARAQAAQADFDSYVRNVASTNGSNGSAAEISKAKQLLDSGAITADEFAVIKQKALAG